MNRHFIALLAAMLLWLASPAWSGTGTPAVQALPLFFEQNSGQFPPEVEFAARTGGTAVLLTRTGVSIQPGLRLRWHGAVHSRPLAGEEPLTGAANYFVGRDPQRWRTSVPLFGKVRYARVYPGISMVFHGTGHQIEQDWIVAPGSRPGRIALDVQGASRISIGESGDLLLESATGQLSLRKPFAWQDTAAGRRAVEVSFALRGARRIGFRLGAYDKKLDLIIDPVLTYSTYFGSGGNATGVALDPAGNIYVAGATSMLGMPMVSAFQNTFGGNVDGFVLKLSPDGSRLIYATYLGGSGQDTLNDIAVDAAGNAYVTGQTSADFPLVHPIQGTLQGNSDAFVAKLGPQGNALIYSTYLGGNSFDGASGIAVDAQGSAYISGWTASADFPAVHPIQASNGGTGSTEDAFVAKLNPAGTALIYATYLGGPDSDHANGIAVDAAGHAYVTGYAGAGFPVRGGLPGNSEPCFVSELAADGGALVYSTYLGTGGSGTCTGIAVDTAGSAYVAGQNQAMDAFVAKLNPSGSQLVYATYLGGSGSEFASRVAVDSTGSAYITGTTWSGDFPVFAAVQGRISSASVLKSADGGATWTGAGSPNVGSLVRSMAIDPKNPATIYLGTQGPLFKSTDGGGHWASVDTGAGSVVALAVDPQTTSTLYAGGDDGVYKSVDGAATWSRVLSPGTQCTSVVVDPKNPARVYAGTWNGGGIYKSTDGGGTWKLAPGPAAGIPVNALAVDPVNPSRIYAAMQPGFFRSTDFGESWQPSAIMAQMMISALAADPVTSGIVYAGTRGAIGKSTDAGVTWLPLQTTLPDTVTAIVIDPRHPSTVYLSVYRDASGYKGAVYRSQDGGATWKLSGPGMTAYKVYALALDAANPPNLYAGGQGWADGFVTKLTPSGGLAYSTYLGGSNYDGAVGIAVDRSGGAVVVGGAASSDFPMKAPLYPALSHFLDTFIARIQDSGTSMPEFNTVSAASYVPTIGVAPDSIVAGFGGNLAAALEVAAATPLPTLLAGRSVSIRDSAGGLHTAPLFMVAPAQVNYLVPADTALGMATVAVMDGQQIVASGPVDVRALAPAIFSANASGQGVAAAQALHVSADDNQTMLDVARWDDQSKRFVSVPMDLGTEADTTVLILYGTGIRGVSSLSAVHAQVGGVDAVVDYAGAQPVYTGLDQVNVRLPHGLAGHGEVEVALTLDGVAANKVTVNIQ